MTTDADPQTLSAAAGVDNGADGASSREVMRGDWHFNGYKITETISCDAETLEKIKRARKLISETFQINSQSPLVSPFGYTHPERDEREMCPYCYNEDTRRLVGLELIPYEEYHAKNPFKAFECEACHAKFHFSTNNPTLNTNAD